MGSRPISSFAVRNLKLDTVLSVKQLITKDCLLKSSHLVLDRPSIALEGPSELGLLPPGFVAAQFEISDIPPNSTSATCTEFALRSLRSLVGENRNALAVYPWQEHSNDNKTTTTKTPPAAKRGGHVCTYIHLRTRCDHVLREERRGLEPRSAGLCAHEPLYQKFLDQVPEVTGRREAGVEREYLTRQPG